MNAPQKPQTGKTITLISADILTALNEQKQKHGLTHAELARRIGVSTTYITRALNGSFIGEAADFERRATEYLAHVHKRRGLDGRLATEGFLIEPMRHFLDSMSHTADIGIAYSPAGKGKTCAAKVYAMAHDLCITVTAQKSLCGWRKLRDAILAELPLKRRKDRESWDEFMVRTFQGSRRLLIVDNAHLLTASARSWLAYDWNEGTGCGVALLGNPQIIQQWKADDQHFSRVGVCSEMKPQSSAASTAAATFELLLPDFAADREVLALAEQVVKSRGSVRALRKHALLCGELLKSKTYKAQTPAQVFRAAHSLLISDTKLTA